jgi:hypothetical protein
MLRLSLLLVLTATMAGMAQAQQTGPSHITNTENSRVAITGAVIGCASLCPLSGCPTSRGSKTVILIYIFPNRHPRSPCARRGRSVRHRALVCAAEESAGRYNAQCCRVLAGHRAGAGVPLPRAAAAACVCKAGPVLPRQCVVSACEPEPQHAHVLPREQVRTRAVLPRKRDVGKHVASVSARESEFA